MTPPRYTAGDMPSIREAMAPYIEAHGRRQLSEDTGLNFSDLCSWLNGRRRWKTIGHIDKMAEAMNVTIIVVPKPTRRRKRRE